MSPFSTVLSETNRRDMLKLSACGLLAGSVSGWLDVVAARAAEQEQKLRQRAKRCIVLFMSGGPAHTFTFDLKLGDRGCPYKAIDTSAEGIQVSEHLPEVAKQMHHVAVVRGMSTGINDHGPAHYLMRTGFRQLAGIVHPHRGSIACSELVKVDTGMPSFVLLKPGSGSLNGASHGFLDPAWRPLTLQDVSKGIANLNPNGSREGLARKTDLLAELDQLFLDDVKADAVKAKMTGYRKAVELIDLEKARLAFQIDKESQATRDLYGDTPFGKQCLGARRLIEHGVQFVEVMHPKYWDTHGGAEKGQKSLSEEMDRPMAALLADLADRGLLDDTLVVWMGEFGRDYTGNNHHAKAWTTLFAGAGVRGGQIIGKSDAKGMTVEDRPVSVADFGATIFNTLGIDHAKETVVRQRPIGYVDGKAKPLTELFA